jgi:hypothetical protein
MSAISTIRTTTDNGGSLLTVDISIERPLPAAAVFNDGNLDTSCD